MDARCIDHPVILVVEDEGLIRWDAAETLRCAGFDVIEASDADEALALVAECPDISLVFTDINMPGPMDGVELARRVHKLHPDIHLILTSGKTALTKDQVPDDGVFLAKPYSPEAMTRTVARMLA